MLGTLVHECEEDPKLFTRADLSKACIVVECTFRFDTIISYVVCSFKFIPIPLSNLLLSISHLFWGQSHIGMMLLRAIESGELVLELRTSQSLDRGSEKLIKLDIHILYN